MKKLLIAMIALLLLIGGTVCAQNAGGQRRTPEERLKMQVDQVKTALTLTDEQVTKVTAILAATTKQTDSVRAANQGGDRTAMMGMMKPFSDARDAKIKAILTPDQAKIFEEKKAELFSFRRPAAPAQQ
jgi:periplasmic protein CpxP/Spy